MLFLLFLFLLQKSVNETCRKSSKRVAFYSVDCRDSCGELFVDLQDYTYSKVLVFSLCSFLCCLAYKSSTSTAIYYCNWCLFSCLVIVFLVDVRFDVCFIIIVLNFILSLMRYFGQRHFFAGLILKD